MPIAQRNRRRTKADAASLTTRQPQEKNAQRLRATYPTVSVPLEAPWQFDDVYAELCKLYAEKNNPIQVNFRELVPVPPGMDRATHLIHPYPAKLLVNIPIFFANCRQLSGPDSLILDPFCGTGTVLLEAMLAGKRAVGADANPLARLISEAKLYPLAQVKLRRTLRSIVERSKKAPSTSFSPVVDVDRWFPKKTANALGKLLTSINRLRDIPTRNFFLVSFSSCVKRASFADPRLSVPVRLKSKDLPEALSASAVRTLFARIAAANIDRMENLNELLPTSYASATIIDDARSLKLSDDDLADLVITSPPYTSAQKYVRASSLSLGWLGLAPGNELRVLERLNIGREHFPKDEYKEKPIATVAIAQSAIDRIWSINRLRAYIASTYLGEMRRALTSAVSALKQGGHFVLIVGDNTVCGERFATGRFLSEILQQLGLSKRLELVDDIRSRGLMTKRNKTAGVITQEHIYVFKKQVQNEDQG